MKGLIFTYVLTYGGAAAALVDPFVGLLVYICFAILRPDDLWFWSVPHGNYSRIVAICMLIGWAIRGFGNWRLNKASIIIVMLVVFWLLAILSMFAAPNYEPAMDYVERLTKIVLPCIVGITIINSIKRLRILAWVFLLSHAYLAFEFNLSYFAGNNRVWTQGFSYLDNNGVGIAMDTAIGFAFFLGLSAPKLWQKALALGSAVLMIHVVLFSFSRGGMLGLIVTGATAFILIPKSFKHYLALVALILIGFQLAGKEVRERFLSSFENAAKRDTAAQERVDLWLACADVMKNQPFLGCGPNHWPLIAESYGFPPLKAAHSTWMQLGAELGVPALLAFAGLFAVTVRRLLPYARNRLNAVDPWFQHAARMVIASIVGYVVSAQFVSFSLLESAYYVLLVGACTLKLASRPQDPALTPIPAAPPGIVSSSQVR